MTIHDLSRTGLLIESAAPLSVGDRIEVDLPATAGAEARVVWCSGRFYGCEFAQPVPLATLSAALLRSPPERPGPEEVFDPAAELQELRARVRDIAETVDRAIERFLRRDHGRG